MPFFLHNMRSRGESTKLGVYNKIRIAACFVFWFGRNQICVMLVSTGKASSAIYVPTGTSAEVNAVQP